jgi:hypothetical protein
MTDSASTLEKVRAAKAQALADFSALADVVGIGITTVGDAYGLKINLAALPNPPVTLPTHVDGIPVKIEVVGTISKRGPKKK